MVSFHLMGEYIVKIYSAVHNLVKYRSLNTWVFLVLRIVIDSSVNQSHPLRLSTFDLEVDTPVLFRINLMDLLSTDIPALRFFLES